MIKTPKKLFLTAILAIPAALGFSQAAVFDANGFAQMLADYSMQSQMYVDQIQQTISVVTQLENQMKDMINFGNSFFSGEGPTEGQMATLLGVFAQATGMKDLLTQADDMLNTHTLFEINGNAYTLADMLGAGKRSYMDFAADCTSSVGKSLRSEAEKWTENLSAADQVYIMERYGISPEDYFLAQKATEEADNALDLAMKQCDSLRTLDLQRNIMSQYQDIQTLLSTAGLSGRVSTTQLAEATAKMTQLQGVQLADISQTLTSYMNMQILKDYQESIQKKAAADYKEQIERDRLDNLSVSTVPSYWRRNPSGADGHGN